MIITDYDLWIWAKTIWGEARGESLQGKIGVAWVIHNRVGKRWKPSIAGVCQQPKQFSCWNAADPNRTKLGRLRLGQPTLVPAEDKALQQCYLAVFMVLNGKKEDDITKGANHYLNEALLRRRHALPSWFKESAVTVRIGRHTFLKL